MTQKFRINSGNGKALDIEMNLDAARLADLLISAPARKACMSEIVTAVEVAEAKAAKAETDRLAALVFDEVLIVAQRA